MKQKAFLWDVTLGICICTNAYNSNFYIYFNHSYIYHVETILLFGKLPFANNKFYFYKTEHILSV